MIVIENKTQLSGLLKKQDLPFGVMQFNVDTFLIANGLEQEVILIDGEVFKSTNKNDIEALYDKLSELNFYFVHTKKYLADLPGLAFQEDFKSQTKEALARFIFIHDQQQENEIIKSELITFEKEITELIKNTEIDLVKVKGLHQRLAKRKKSSYPGIDIYSKYKTGQGNGGDFFDVIERDRSIVLIQTKLNTYSGLTEVYNEIAHLKFSKQSLSKNTVSQFVSKLINNLDFIAREKQKEIKLDYCITLIDIDEKIATYFWSGNYVLLNWNKNKLLENLLDGSGENGREFYLSQLNLFMLFSPGTFEHYSLQRVCDFYKNLFEKEPTIRPYEIIDEFFFALNQEFKEELRDDVTLIIGEGREHAELKILKN